MGFFQKLFHKKQKKQTKKPSSHYAPLETFMLVKADRINQRLYEFTKREKARKQTEPWRGYTEKDIDEIVKAIGIIISQELTIKGKEEWQWENLMRKKTMEKTTRD